MIISWIKKKREEYRAQKQKEIEQAEIDLQAWKDTFKIQIQIKEDVKWDKKTDAMAQMMLLEYKHQLTAGTLRGVDKIEGWEPLVMVPAEVIVEIGNYTVIHEPMARYKHDNIIGTVVNKYNNLKKQYIEQHGKGN